MYNPWRQEWELPAGLIEAGETAHDAAVRELYEETSQKVTDLQYAGLVLLGLPPDGQHQLGATYTCNISEPQPFIANNEASAIVWWEPSSQVEGYVNALASWLVLNVR